MLDHQEQKKDVQKHKSQYVEDYIKLPSALVWQTERLLSLVYGTGHHLMNVKHWLC